MAFKKPGNSREDKSASASGRPPRSGASFKKSSSYKESSPFSKFKKTDTGSKPARKYGADSTDKNRNSSENSDKRRYSAENGEKKPYGTGSRGKTAGGDDRPFKKFAPRGEGTRPDARRSDTGEDRRPLRSRTTGEGKYSKPKDGERTYTDRPRSSEDRPARVMRSRNNKGDDTRPKTHKKVGADNDLIRLNRYISNAGICSRRKADELIAAGVVSVNGEVVSELGAKINPSKDVIRYNGETLKREKMVYVLLNKPKDYITTTEDPQERRTVMHLVEKASKERIYPIGRLDRNTTGLLLMTNDGDLADKLSHPRNSITKLYQVELSKNLTQGDLNKISFGLELEDGLIKPDAVTYVQGGTKREIGIQIHSGKNRIVRRIFEHLGYEVVKLDRTIYANLTKKDLPRGRWRYLEESEVIQLKHLI